MSSGCTFNIRSKGQKSRSQGHKVQQHIKGDRMAGVSLHSTEWPWSIIHVTYNSNVRNKLFFAQARNQTMPIGGRPKFFFGQ